METQHELNRRIEALEKELAAKNRDLEIEAALERVRARTMAMQKSDELTDVASLLFKQVSDLGIKIWTTGFKVWSDDNNFCTDYVTNPQGGFIEPYTIDSTQYPVFVDVSNAKKRGDAFFVNYEEGEQLAETYRQLSKYGQKQFKAILDSGFQFPSKQYEHHVFGSKVSLMFITYEPVPEAHDIFKRFGKVFEQTYTRFLDLQKAEAQAREAQIEAGLERVRSRSMGMQKSVELREVVAVIFQQMQKLGFDLNLCNILLVDQATLEVDYWLSFGEQEILPESYHIPYFDHPVYHYQLNAWKDAKPFEAFEVSGTLKTSWDEYLMTQTDIKKISESIKEMMRKLEKLIISSVATKNGLLQTVSIDPLSPESISILQRFAKVFEQTYTRFLDLQKAEAQAREAKIEAALERVRGRAMAMQSSPELSDLVSILFEELTKLDLVLARCIIWILDPDTYGARVWMANSEDKKTADSYFIKRLYHPYYEAIIEGWKQRQTKWVYDLKGTKKRSLDELLLNETELSRLPEAVRTGIATSEHTTVSGSFNNFGFIEASGPVALTDEQMEILTRFTKVFDLTYTRFNDLKQAEARALIAIKEASLNRIRAEIASMRTANDLQRITPSVWKELTVLGIPFFRCGVFIISEKEQIVHMYLSTRDGKPLAVLHLDFNSSKTTRNVAEYWRVQKVYGTHWDREEFTAWVQSLIGQGQIKEATTYQAGQEPPESLSLQFVPFVQGMLYIGSAQPLTETQIELVQALAEAFSVAYARYEDFNNLERAKQQVEFTLDELKSTQAQLIQREKMASLGELTAGIAHEIQNPLNFVNNFSEVNTELIAEMKEEIGKGNIEVVKTIANDIEENEEKIIHHGKRADAIVKGMLQHSRISTGQKEPTDINALADEYLRLSYHGMRAKDKSFNATIKTNFEIGIAKINVVPQDIGRVLLNLFNNAFYSVMQKKKQANGAYEPTVSVCTKKVDSRIEIHVKDNGVGIPLNIVDKVFQPFFTTKPTGQGTGLGLSLSYDIVKTHGGEIKVETKEGEGAEFIIQLP